MTDELTASRGQGISLAAPAPKLAAGDHPAPVSAKPRIGGVVNILEKLLDVVANNIVAILRTIALIAACTFIFIVLVGWATKWKASAKSPSSIPVPARRSNRNQTIGGLSLAACSAE